MNPVGCKQGMVAGVVFQPISVQTLLGCDFFALIHGYTITQKIGFSSVRRLFTFATIFCVFVLQKGDVFAPIHGYTLQNDHFLFVYLIFFCSTNRRPNI